MVSALITKFTEHLYSLIDFTDDSYDHYNYSSYKTFCLFGNH
jgi:hypothetical protein